MRAGARLGAAAAGAALALLVAGAGVGGAAADSGSLRLDAYGWWSQLNGAAPGVGVSIPAMPGTPPDGIQLSANATGPNAIGAVRYRSVPAGADTVLTLRVASGSPSQTGAVFDACPVTGPWKAAEGGRFADRPSYDSGAGACAEGVPAADGSSITWKLPAASEHVPGTVDVALVLSSPAPLTVALARPVASDLALAPATSSPAADSTGLGGPPATPAPAPASGVSASGGGGAPPVGGPASGSGGGAAPGPGAASASGSSGALGGSGASTATALASPVAGAPSPAAPGASATGNPDRGGATLAPVSSVVRGVSDSRVVRVAAVGLLLVIAAALFWFGGQSARDPERIGNLGARMGGRPETAAAAARSAPLRGIGRFARPREGRLHR